MANDLSGDSACVALYNFESGALTTDSKGSNTLTNQNTVNEDTVDFIQGACSADFIAANNEIFYITDASLASGFPCKTGDSTLNFSIFGRFKLDINPGTYGDTKVIVAKSNVWDSTVSSFLLEAYRAATDAPVLRLTLYYTDDTSSTYDHTTGISIDAWYDFGISYEHSTKGYLIRLYDSSHAHLGTDKAGTGTNKTIDAASAKFSIGGRYDYSAKLWDGHIDELAVFNDILSTAEMDQLAAGTYGAAGVSIPVFMHHYTNLRRS